MGLHTDLLKLAHTKPQTRTALVPVLRKIPGGLKNVNFPQHPDNVKLTKLFASVFKRFPEWKVLGYMTSYSLDSKLPVEAHIGAVLKTQPLAMRILIKPGVKNEMRYTFEFYRETKKKMPGSSRALSPGPLIVSEYKDLVRKRNLTYEQITTLLKTLPAFLEEFSAPDPILDTAKKHMERAKQTQKQFEELKKKP